MAYNLRPYQVEAVNKLRDGIRQGMLAQVLMSPTGSGKTVLASFLVNSAVSRGRRVFFIVDTLELIDQAVVTFGKDGLEDDIGVIQGDHWLTDYSRMIQVATIQTLRARWDRMPESMRPTLVFIDEVQVFHKAHEEIMKWCREKKIPVIGLSATPFRKGLAKHFDRLVVGVTISQLTDEGFLKPALCYSPGVPDLSGVKTGSDGDWVDDALAEVMGDAAIMGDVVEQWAKLADGRQTIAFGCNVAHARAMAAAFVRAGIKAAEVDGYMKEDERTDIINRYRAGQITVLCNVAVLTKGFDAPETSCIILARPTKSIMMHYQMMGRGIRIHPNSVDCIIIDHAGNCLRNGQPTDPLPEELDDGSKKRVDRREKDDKKVKEAKACWNCGYMHMAASCPQCFAEVKKFAQDVDSAAGELVALASSRVQPKKLTTEKKQDVYAQFLGYAKHHGYKEGWAYYKCQEFCGSAPKNKKQTPRYPDADVLAWIKHRNIKAAKAKARA